MKSCEKLSEGNKSENENSWKTAVKRESVQNPAGLQRITCWMQPIDRAFILSLRPLGSFVYLDMLKEPFFKIESDYYMIKGVQGKDYFRIAVHGKHEEELEKLERFLG